MTSRFAGIPVWKAARELRRMRKHLSILHWPLLGKFYRNIYDRNRARLVRETEGRVPSGSEVAIILIYQPKGVLGSTLATLRWFAEQGIAPVVVSNLPLSDADRTKLAELSYLVIERPNVGYDFGGYRDGVLTVLERGLAMRALYVLNDSMWFPLRSECDVIGQCRASGDDIFGLHLSYLSKSSRWNEHIQSYFFRFSERILASADFAAYWRKLPLMEDKRAVVRYCERPLSWHFAKRGYSFGGLVSWKQVVDWLLAEQDNALLERIFRYQCSISPKEADLIEPMFERGLSALEIRDALRDQIARRRVFSTLVSLHPELLLALGVPFLKKARTPDMVAQRHEIARLGLADSFLPDVRAEILSWDSGEPVVSRDANPQQG